MGIVGSLVILFLLFFSQTKYKSISCPLVFTNLLFLVIVFGASLHLYGMNKDNDIAFFYIILGMVFLNAGFYFSDTVASNNKAFSKRTIGNSERTYAIKSEVVANKKGIIIILALLIFFTVYYLIETSTLLARGYSLSMIRLMYFGGDELIDSVASMHRSSFIVIGTTYIYSPCQYLCIALASYTITDQGFLHDSPKLRIILIVVTIMNIISSMLSNGGRVVLYLLIMDTLLSHFFLRSHQRIEINHSFNLKKTRRFVLLLVSMVGMIIVANYVTSERESSSSTVVRLIQSIYYYFCGCVPNMQAKIQQFGTRNGEYTFGFLMPMTIIRPFFTGMNFVLKVGVPRFYSICDQFLFDAATTHAIGKNLTYNAFVSMFYYFYRDFNYIGVVFDSFLLGIISSCVYRRARERKGTAFVVYLVAMEGLSIAFVRMQLVSVGYVLAFYYSLLVFNRTKKRIIE